MKLQIELDAEEALFQTVNLAVGPISRKRFQNDRDAVLEAAIMYLSGHTRRILATWAPSLETPEAP